MDSPIIPVAVGRLTSPVARVDLTEEPALAFIGSQVTVRGSIRPPETDPELDVLVAAEVVAPGVRAASWVIAHEVVVAGGLSPEVSLSPLIAPCLTALEACGRC